MGFQSPATSPPEQMSEQPCSFDKPYVVIVNLLWAPLSKASVRDRTVRQIKVTIAALTNTAFIIDKIRY